MLIYECWPNRHEPLASYLPSYLPRRCEYPPVITHKPSTSAQGNSLRVRLSAITSSLALVISALVVLTSPQASANTYAVPAAPTITKAYVTDAGIRVRFNPVSASPAVTHYVVTGGQGSCPVVVPATTSGSVRLPILEGQTSATVNVQAVNAYGFSPAAKWSKTFTATAVASTITLSSGDNIGAAPAISSQFEELPTIESMNLMKFDVSTFGNHEHDRNIAHVQKVIGASDFAWVASNYSSLEPLKSGTKAAKSYVIIDRGGVKVGVVGMNTDETPEVIFPGNLDYTDASGAKKTLQISASVAGVNQAIKDAKSAGADIVVALLHYGWSENADGLAKGQLLDLAKGIKGAAAVLGGHSHQRYSSIMGTSARYGSTLIAQTPNAGVGYNRIQLCVSGSRVQGASLDYVTTADLKGVTADTAGAALVNKYKDQLVTKLDVKIGQVSELFPRGGTPAVERAGETPMGNYLADLMRKELKTDFALTNGGGLRDTFPAATYKAVDTTYKRPAAGVTGPFDVTLGDAISVLPFGNSVAVATISGTQLWAALENGVSQHPSGGRFPQISGFKFSFDTSKAVGSRITAVTKLDGTAIAKDAKTYTVATNDFMLYGGDGYTMLNPSTAKFPGKLLLDILVDGIKADLAAKRVTQTPKADGRITKVG
ncbi:MAG: bifunctional metallophosphatase/5'-nucleotidase [Actinobacteria bacterium]|nr:bifunctional metallophosphatase/5'-nucleotidase [Actinomycetota bacterium]